MLRRRCDCTRLTEFCRIITIHLAVIGVMIDMTLVMSTRDEWHDSDSQYQSTDLPLWCTPMARLMSPWPMLLLPVSGGQYYMSIAPDSTRIHVREAVCVSIKHLKMAVCSQHPFEDGRPWTGIPCSACYLHQCCQFVARNTLPQSGDHTSPQKQSRQNDILDNISHYKFRAAHV